MSNTRHRRIARLAGMLHAATVVALIGVPAIAIGAILLGEAGTDALRQSFEEVRLPAVITPGMLISIRLIEAIGLGFVMAVLWHMRGLFWLYRNGDTLTPACARHILRAGQGLVAVGIHGFVANTVSILILTLGNAPGERTLSIGFTDGDIGFLMAGGLIVVIGWVMAEASDIAADNAAII